MLPFPTIPRPEYPRPDRQRGQVEGVDWVNLNGPWQFRFDPRRAGVDEKWFTPSPAEWREQILVPFCWESLAAWGQADAAGNNNYYATRVFVDPLSVTQENHRSAPRYEVGWYRRLITIPDNEHWTGQRVILTVGAADFATDCWCNGIHCGRHEGGYVPFEFDLTDHLGDDPHHALVVLRVEDAMDNREQPVGKQWGWYTPTSGIWQTVFLEPRGAAYVESFKISTDIDAGRAKFEIRCANAADNALVTVEITSPVGATHRLRLRTKDGGATGDTKIFPLVLWGPQHPQLYKVKFRLTQNGQKMDLVRSYFGMRKIGSVPGEGEAPAMLSLNNQQIYLRGALYQSYHPDGVYTAGDASTLRRDIGFARKSGFDFLRIHIKLDDPLLLYYADLEGMLLMQDFPNFGEGGDTPTGRRRFEEMLRAGMQRDFNHPSIIAWCLFNETWGFGGQTELIKLLLPQTEKDAPPAPKKFANLSSFKWVHEMWQIAKEIDPTRLIEDMSVVPWEHLAEYGHVETDINSWHFYIDDYAKAKAHIQSVVAQTYRGSRFNYVEGYRQRGVPLINSEYGGVGALDGDRDISWSFRFLTNELRIYGQLSAYIYTELHDVEWESNGLLNYDRTAKSFGYPPNMVNQGDVLPINAAPISTIPPKSTVNVEVLSSHFSRRRRDEISLHWQYSGMDTLGHEYPDLERGHAPIGFPQYRVELARRLALTVPDHPMLCTLAVVAQTATGETVAGNYIQHFVSTGPLPLRDDRGKTLVLRQRVQDWTVSNWTGGQSNPEDAKNRGSCYGFGTGSFEWHFSDPALRDLGKARRLRLICEVSAARRDETQTDSHRTPTDFELLLNDVPVHRTVLPDHPHDSRGALSYLRGGRGAYGYLVRTAIEDQLLHNVASTIGADNVLRFRCEVPATGTAGGLTVYDYDCGRFPVGLTLVLEWEQP